ncbi:hypothetical protein GH714_019683 [Hevea brasiliensis]|uniref:Bulb-type lectin domain-containing protein n=1 Tax=Hevea brasiliensis TaxID=3981 RepID=A0A6A6LSY1_HEVBR|nr:hypothetical protein GH714_019683 [Hevea brasiliensis]
MNRGKMLPIILLIVFIHPFCTSLDTVTINQPIIEGDIIVSTGENFTLGFFSPGKSNYHYLGILYNKISEKTVVWVANWDSPINDTSGALSINSHGKLALNKKNQTTPLWLTNVLALSTNNCVAQLLDSGNLVLFHSGSAIWQSFEHPTNTLLPNLKLELDRRIGLNWFLISWKSSDDPGIGNLLCKINPEGYLQLFLYDGHVPNWRAVHWNAVRWSAIPFMQRVTFTFNYSYMNNENENTWQNGANRWSARSNTKDLCDLYGHSGANSNCDSYNAGEFERKCLPGFEPKSSNDWCLKDPSGGCVRKKQGLSTCSNGEGIVKVPGTSTASADMSLSLKEYTITINQPIAEGDIIVSAGETFALGFFSPGKSSYRYLGIWYNKISEKPVVWIANRDIPISDTFGVLSINSHGNLALNSRNRAAPLWFTNVSALPTNNCVAQLLDSGNLVLFHSRSVIWQSFEYPTNTMLPNLKLGLDRRTGLNRFLTSWKSSDDPGAGNFSQDQP